MPVVASLGIPVTSNEDQTVLFGSYQCMLKLQQSTLKHAVRIILVRDLGLSLAALLPGCNSLGVLLPS